MDRADCLKIACAAYDISYDERQSVLNALRKAIEDNPGCEISVRTVSLNSGVGPQKTKIIFYSLLYAGTLVCDPVGDDGIIHFYGRNVDGSVRRRAQVNA